MSWRRRRRRKSCCSRCSQPMTPPSLRGRGAPESHTHVTQHQRTVTEIPMRLTVTQLTTHASHILPTLMRQTVTQPTTQAIPQQRSTTHARLPAILPQLLIAEPLPRTAPACLHIHQPAQVEGAHARFLAVEIVFDQPRQRRRQLRLTHLWASTQGIYLYIYIFIFTYFFIGIKYAV